MPALTDAGVKQALVQLPGWQVKDNAIEKTFELSSFSAALAFVQKLAELEECAQHQPDVVIRSHRVTLVISAHGQDGLTRQDLALAEKVEKLPQD